MAKWVNSRYKWENGWWEESPSAYQKDGPEPIFPTHWTELPEPPAS